VPADSDQLLRDLDGAPSWMFFANDVLFATTTAYVIDTSISKVVGCHAAVYCAMPWGDARAIERQRVRPNMRPPKRRDETPAVAAKRSHGRVERSFGIPT